MIKPFYTHNTNEKNCNNLSLIKERVVENEKSISKLVDSDLESFLFSEENMISSRTIVLSDEDEEQIYEWNLENKENTKFNRDIQTNLNFISGPHIIQTLSIKKRSNIIQTEFIYENMQEVDDIVLKTYKKIKNSLNDTSDIVSYEEVNVDDPYLIDYFFYEFLKIEKKYKKSLTSKKLIKENFYIPPLPSEALDRHKFLNKGFKVNFHHNPAPTGRPQTGYCYRVVCEQLNLNEFYKVENRKELPSSKLREYISQKILKILYPGCKKWVDLIKILNFKY